MAAGSTPEALLTDRASPERAAVLRTLFVYGPMMADEALMALIGRVPTKRPAVLAGYVRVCKQGAEQISGVCSTQRSLVRNGYPATVQSVEGTSVEGILLERLRPQEMSAFDFYEDDTYKRQLVQVTAENGFGGQEVLPTLCYVWPSDRISELDLRAPWEYTKFRTSNMKQFVESVILPCRKAFEKEAGALEAQMTARSERSAGSS